MNEHVLRKIKTNIIITVN